MQDSKTDKSPSLAETHPYAFILAVCLTLGGLGLLLIKGYWYALVGAPIALLLGFFAYGGLRIGVSCKDEHWLEPNRRPRSNSFDQDQIAN